MLKNIAKHQVSKNLFFLVILQVANYLFPLLSWPFLSKMLNLNEFGQLMIIYAIFSLALVLTDFGFNLSASHHISINRDDKNSIAQTLGNVFGLKFGLAILAVIATFIYISVLGKLGEIDLLSLVLVLGTIFVQAFQCIWFFQGIEKMKHITKATLISRTFYLVLLVAIIPFIPTLSIALLCYFISQVLVVYFYFRAIRAEGYHIGKPKADMLLGELKHSFSFFISRVAVSTYTTINTIIIGSLNGTTASAMYGSAEKLYIAGSSVSGMLSQAVYPNMAKTHNFKLLLKIVVATAIPYFLSCYIVSLFAEDIMTLAFGEAFKAGGYLLNLFLILMCITFVSITIGYPGFAALEKVQWANYTVIVGSIFHFIGLFTLYSLELINEKNILLMVICTESVILSLRIILLTYLYRKAK